jgi:hypothetical protein
LQNNYKKNLVEGPRVPGDLQPLDDPEGALNSIKTNIANSSYSLAADFQEQKALISALLEAEQKKKEEEKNEEDKALQYVKQFIDEKKKKEQEAIDEYRNKIQKDFDVKQKEFMDKQKAQKEKKMVVAQKGIPKGKSVPAAPAAPTTPKVPDRPTLPVIRNAARSAGIDGAAKAGDFEGVEKQTRIKKPERNPAAEGAKLDNLNLKYSSEKGNKQFFHRRRVDIQKVNEKLGFFGGGILEGDAVTGEDTVV